MTHVWTRLNSDVQQELWKELNAEPEIFLRCGATRVAEIIEIAQWGEVRNTGRRENIPLGGIQCYAINKSVVSADEQEIQEQQATEWRKWTGAKRYQNWQCEKERT